MVALRIGNITCAAALLSVCGACQMVGPVAIDAGRDRYNNVLQSTAMEQTLANIIRARNHLPTTFMDVSEVDATQSLVGSVNGGLTNIGAVATKSTTAGTLAGELGNVAGSTTYNESPTVRYLPLTGNGLVSQLIDPLTTDALESLYNSSWKAGPLFDLATYYQTFDTDYNEMAANITSYLSLKEWVSLVATKSQLTKAQDSLSGQLPAGTSTVTLQVSNKSSSGGANDSLTVFLRTWDPTFDKVESIARLYLWIALLYIYDGTQAAVPPAAADQQQCRLELDTYRHLRLYGTDWRMSKAGLQALANQVLSQRRVKDNSWKRFLTLVHKCVPKSIELRTMTARASAKAPGKKSNDAADASEALVSPAPLLKTYSALGILKHATGEGSPKFAFVTPAEFQQITHYSWNLPDQTRGFDFYTLLPDDEESKDKPDVSDEDGEITRWIERGRKLPDDQGILVYFPPEKNTGVGPKAFSDPHTIRGNRRLAQLRRYILIVMDDHPPANAYVAHFDRGTWYYVDGSDSLSQKNFELVSLFLTMMAVPPTTQPLTPTISVGGNPG